MEQPRSNSRYLDHHHFESNCSLSLRYRLMNETSTVQQKNKFPNQKKTTNLMKIFAYVGQKKKDPLYRRYLEGDTSVGLPGDGKYDLIVQYSDKKEEPRHQILSQAEKVLNYQTENFLAQNQLLSVINHKVDQLAEGYNKRLHSLQNSVTEIHGRLNNLHQEMMTMARHMMVDSTQLKDLQRNLESMIHNQRQPDAYFNPLGCISSRMPMYHGSYSPGFLASYKTQKTRSPLPCFLSSDEVFTFCYSSTSINYPKPKPTRTKPRRQKESEFQVNPPKIPTLTLSFSHEYVDD
ncbi:hypothetical protein F2Q70_00043188 [Brassica cretica]|uniref:Uncharacterized protein n=1 Tax=Brassica cretica TaxID=69181 RepID=A0A8S9LLK5_BRACR|nr:hypothetical protein F2Q70_00043188 [Brassica cretica]KAF2606839.1 hypothetical protein F2Q68_00044010 [Brassica cretica]